MARRTLAAFEGKLGELIENCAHRLAEAQRVRDFTIAKVDQEVAVLVAELDALEGLKRSPALQKAPRAKKKTTKPESE